MEEASEITVQKETKVYSSKETHRNWEEKARRLIETAAFTGATITLYGTSVVSALNAGLRLEKAGGIRSTFQAIQSYAEQVGGMVSLESIQQISELANTDEKTAVLALAAAGTSFIAGTFTAAAALKSASR